MKARQNVRILDIFSILESINPRPTTELVFQNGFQLLVAVILSAQATDKSVNKATEALFKDISTPSQLAKMSISTLESYIKSIGLYHNKAKHLLAMSKMLIDKFAGKVPKTRAELESLPGVGRKTANVILNTLYHEPVIAVDTHVFRVSRRLGLASSTSILGVEKELYQAIPKQFLLNAHHYLVLHGRYICKAKNPLCMECPLIKLCSYEDKRYSTN